jgi:hypothetical protein
LQQACFEKQGAYAGANLESVSPCHYGVGLIAVVAYFNYISTKKIG